MNQDDNLPLHYMQMKQGFLNVFIFSKIIVTVKEVTITIVNSFKRHKNVVLLINYDEQ